MKHPLTGKAIYLYAMIWLLIMAVHLLVLHQLYEFEWLFCLFDTIIFYVPLAGFGLSYFYVVKYFSPSPGLSFNAVIAHFTGVLLAVSIISFFWKIAMQNLYSGEVYDNYLTFSTQWHIVTGSLLMFLLILIYYLYYNLYEIRQKDKKETELQNMLRQTEMEMLKFQINPHFIFNSLNSISALTMDAPEQAQEMVIKLSDFFRSALGKSREGIHTLEQELDQVRLYLEIEKVRFGDRLTIRENLDEHCLEKRVPAMILQPLFENAIKHGLYEKLEKVTISTKVVCQDNHLKISVSNPYDSMTINRNGKGIGLKNVRSRLELMYHIPDLVTIERSKDQFTVHLLIPQFKNDQNPSH